MFSRLGGGGEGGYSGPDRKRKRGNREEKRLSLYSITSFVFFVLFFRPKKKFYGKDCCSLAVTIRARMNLQPILPHSTGRNCKLGLLSLTRHNLSLVMDFLDPQAILPSSRAKKDFVAPTSPPQKKKKSSSSPAPTCFPYSVVGPSPFLVFLTLSSSPFGYLHAGPSWMFGVSVWGLDVLSALLFSGCTSRSTLSCCTHRC